MGETELNYGAMMFLHGVCNARNADMMLAIMKSDDPEMASLDLQLRIVIDHCLFLAVARGDIDQTNFEEIMESYTTMPTNPFLMFGRDIENEESVHALNCMVVGVVRPMLQYLSATGDDGPEVYIAFLQTLDNVYGPQ